MMQPFNLPKISQKSLALLIVAILLKLPVLLITIQSPQRVYNGGDSAQYLVLAQNIVDYGSFSLAETTPLSPDISRTPGYPLFLAVLYLLNGHQHSAILIVLLQIVLAVANVYLVLWIGRKLFKGQVAYLGALIYGLSPIVSLYSGLAMTETLFTTTLLLGLLLLVSMVDDHSTQIRKNWIFVVSAGVLFAISVYIRPIGLYFIPIPMLALLTLRGLNRQSILMAFVLGFTFFATLIPWYARNYYHYHAIVFTSIANKNLIEYNLASVEAQREKIPLAEAKGRLWKEVGDILHARNLDNADEAQFNRISGEVAFAYIWAHPLDVLFYQSTDMINAFRPGYSMMTLMLQDNAKGFGADMQAGNLSSILKAPMPDKLIYILMTVYYVLFYIFLLLGLVIAIYKHWWAALCICILNTLWFIYVPGIAGNARFRAPVEGLLALIAAVSIVALWEQFKLWRSKKHLAPSQG